MKTIGELIEENEWLKKDLENEIKEKEEQRDRADSWWEEYNKSAKEVEELEKKIEEIRENLDISEQVIEIAYDMFSIWETKRKITTDLNRTIYLVVE